jgi:clan AA aspartic protease (TIGR02281 family)
LSHIGRIVGLVALLLGLTVVVPFAAATSHPQADPATAPPGGAEVPLKDDGSGTFLVPVMINDAVRLDFTLDSGASVVTIPADVAMTLMRTGTVTRDDYIGNATFQLADGSTVPSPILRIRSLKVGNVELKNVEASVSDTKGSLLLGETFLAAFTSWSIDNQRHVLILGAVRPEGAPTIALAQHPTRTHHPAHDTDTGGPPDTAATTSTSGRPETAKGVEWDATFYQTCLTDMSKDLSQSAAQTLCHCVGAQLQPLPLSRKKRLVPHSHEVLAAKAQCRR